MKEVTAWAVLDASVTPPRQWPGGARLETMPDGDVRRLEILQRLDLLDQEHRVSVDVALHRLCDLGRELLGADDVGIALLSPDTSGGVLATSTGLTRRIEELQFTLDEGPSVDAARTGRPQLVEELESPVWAEWPTFAPQAVSAGVRAVFALPVHVAAVQLGVLDICYVRPHQLGVLEMRDAFVLADIAADLLLGGQEGAVVGTTAEGLAEALDYRDQLFQAQGMVMVQLGVDLGEAMARLRAYALAHEIPLLEVAEAVVERRLRLPKDGG